MGRPLFTASSGLVFAAACLAASSNAYAAPVTLMCQSAPGQTSHLQIEPDILIVDEAAGTVDFTEGAWRYAPPAEGNAHPTSHLGTFPASFSQNEITFQSGIEVYHLNRLSGSFTDYNVNSGAHLDRDMVCHPQQRQF